MKEKMCLKRDIQHLLLVKLKLMSSMTESENFKTLLPMIKECKLILLAEQGRIFHTKAQLDQRLEKVLLAKLVLV